MSAVHLPHELRRAVRRASLALAAIGVIALSDACDRRAAEPFRPSELWFYYLTNFGEDDVFETLEPIWRRASAAGYTHVMLADHKFARLGEMDSVYLGRLERAKTLASELGLEIVPSLFQVGRSGSMLAHDPHLVEAMPVRDVPFEVREGEARIVPDLESGLAPRPARVDRTVRVEGGVATIGAHPKRARFMVRARVQPFRCYRISAEIRTEAYTGRPLIHALAGRQPISYTRSLGVEASQPWKRHGITINSLDHHALDVWFGDWDDADGLLQWREWRLDDIGPLNVVRREGAPLSIRRDDPTGGPAVVEGRDIGPIADSLLGASPWRGQFDDTHLPPRIPSTLPEGTRLRISWAMAGIANGQVMCCVSEPGTLALLRDEARRMRDLWGARAYMMMHDEIRVMNWDDACQSRRLTPGQLLADHVRACTDLLEGARVYVWGDMFDPFQNATRNYYLVNGDLTGSWEGLGKEVVIVNWNADRMESSLRFFAGRGHRQVIAGYYDGRPRDIRPWLRAASEVDGVLGVMFTTWRHDFEDLEAFALECGRRTSPAP